MIPGSAYTDLFTTKNGASVPVNADQIPTVVILLDGVLTSVLVDVVIGSVGGEYVYTFDVPSNWTAENEAHARITAVIDGWPRTALRRLEPIRVDSPETVRMATQVQELYQVAGLDETKPLFIPPEGGFITTGDVKIEVTGDCTAGHTMTRQ